MQTVYWMLHPRPKARRMVVGRLGGRGRRIVGTRLRRDRRRILQRCRWIDRVGAPARPATPQLTSSATSSRAVTNCRSPAPTTRPSLSYDSDE
ncbi:MAG: hypothetical protein U0232_23285 [Thermomicrobiales bacterium]